MTEDTPSNPCSKKGEVRAKISDRLLSETRSGNLQALIARSADFYGPHTPLSFVNVMVFDNLKAGKKPQWLGNDLVKHSFTYTPDASKATAILGNAPEAYNQVWHVPTHPDALTGKEFITLASLAFDKQGIQYTLLKKWMVGMIAPFNRIIKESLEMIYQSEYEYLFDSSKFDKFFNYRPVTYPEGIIETARSMK
jgi:nucleoside-diphosphate-sugar epimerase